MDIMDTTTMDMEEDTLLLVGALDLGEDMEAMEDMVDMEAMATEVMVDTTTDVTEDLLTPCLMAVEDTVVAAEAMAVAVEDTVVAAADTVVGVEDTAADVMDGLLSLNPKLTVEVMEDTEDTAVVVEVMAVVVAMVAMADTVGKLHSDRRSAL